MSNKPNLNKECGFSHKLYKLMQEKKESQEDIRKLLGCSIQAVGYYLRGESMPDLDKLIILAKHFDASIDYFLGLSDVISPNIDVKAMIDYTGLTEDAISILHKINLHEPIPEDGEIDTPTALSKIIELDNSTIPSFSLAMRNIVDGLNAKMKLKQLAEKKNINDEMTKNIGLLNQLCKGSQFSVVTIDVEARNNIGVGFDLLKTAMTLDIGSERLSNN